MSRCSRFLNISIRFGNMKRLPSSFIVIRECEVSKSLKFCVKQGSTMSAVLLAEFTCGRSISIRQCRCIDFGGNSSDSYCTMNDHPHDPLHGMTLEAILTLLVERHGWETLAQRINVRCFTNDPSIKSSLTFLRKTPWARQKVEAWYLYDLRRGIG